MRVAAYVRCSTDEQAESPATQLELIRDYCVREGHTLVHEYVDEGQSGGLEHYKRPQALAMWQAAQAGEFEAIVARSQRRLGRDSLDLQGMRRTAKKLKIRLLFTQEIYTDDATGDFQWTIMSAQAQFERQLTGERVRNNARHLAKQGKWPAGFAPLGLIYDKTDKTLKPDPGRARDAVLVFETFVKCNGNKLQTARMLNAMGIKTRKGNLWRDDAVSTIVTNPIYRGILHYQEIRTPTDYIPRIISDELITKVDALLEPRPHITIRSAQRLNPYSGLMTCANCGYSYKMQKATKNSIVYVCRGRKEMGQCKSSGIGLLRLDRLVGECLQTALVDEKELIRSASRGQSKKKLLGEREIENLKEAKRRLTRVYVAGNISDEDYDKQVAELDGQLVAAIKEEPARLIPTQEILALIDSFDTDWSHWNPELKHSFLLVTARRILVYAVPPEPLKLEIRTAIGHGLYTAHE